MSASWAWPESNGLAGRWGKDLKVRKFGELRKLATEGLESMARR